MHPSLIYIHSLILCLSVLPPSEIVVDESEAVIDESSITISWSVESAEMSTAVVDWELASDAGARAVRQTDSGTSDSGTSDSGTSDPIMGSSYPITGLKSGTAYYITITVTNPAGSRSTNITLSTDEGTSWNCEYVAVNCHCVSQSPVLAAGVVVVVMLGLLLVGSL